MTGGASHSTGRGGVQVQAMEQGRLAPICGGWEVQLQREEAETERLPCFWLLLQLDRQKYFISFS